MGDGGRKTEDKVQYQAERIRKCRLFAGIATQKELALRAGLSPTIISDLERGRRTLSDSWALRIAEAEGTTPKYLLEGQAE